MSEKGVSKPIRVVIADDHALVRDGIRLSLEYAGMVVVGEARDGLEAVSLVRKLSPDILLLDLKMPQYSGLEALERIHEVDNPVRTILLTAEANPVDIATAIGFGARGVVLKASATEVLVRAIRTVMAARFWVGLKEVSNINDYLKTLISPGKTEPGKNTFSLTPRELQIISAVVSGRSNKQIASRFGIAEDTVKHHLSNIYDKAGASNRVELVVFAYTHKLPIVDLD